MGTSSIDLLRKASGSPRSAFTIVELLVSISVLAILIALVVPSISGAARSAASTQCLANLRSIYLLMETLPPESASYWPTLLDANNRSAEVVARQGQIGIGLGFSDPIWQTRVWIGPLFGPSDFAYGEYENLDERTGAEYAETLGCPDLDRLPQPDGGWPWFFRAENSFRYSAALFTSPKRWQPGLAAEDPGNPVRVPRAAVAFPSRKVAMSETRDFHGTLGLVQASEESPLDRELRANAVFADGHAELTVPSQATPAIKRDWSDIYPLPSIPTSLVYSSPPNGYLGYDF